jgi:hypothetical protein
VRLWDNPIFLTQKRLVHRGGVWAAILISALVGGSLLLGLLAHVTDPRPAFRGTPQEMGKVFYAGVLAVEALVLVVGGFLRIARVLSDERKAGLWESNRLTPLSAARIVLGYWLGSPLRECYMAATFASFGLLIVVVGKLPLSLWLGTQLLVVSTALFFGLFALVVGIAFERPQSGVVLFPPLLFFYMVSAGAPQYSVLQYLLPIHAAARLFFDPSTAASSFEADWYGPPELFSLPVPSMALSLGLQLVVGLFLWRAAVRKTANPSQALLLRWEVSALVALLAIVQHGLLWGFWSGSYPQGTQRHTADFILALVHGGTLLVGTLLLAVSSPLPERVRIAALRGGTGPRLLLGRSAVPLAFVLAAIAGLASLPHFIHSFWDYGVVWGLATANLFACFTLFALLLEYCRLRFRHGALGFVALGLFVLGGLPLILAVLFASEPLALLSFLAPGILALLEPARVAARHQVALTLVQLGVVFLLFLAWWQAWRQLFARTLRRS